MKETIEMRIYRFEWFGAKVNLAAARELVVGDGGGVASVSLAICRG